MKALLKIFVFLFLCLGGSSTVLADGSKDMYPRYPEPVKGNRAYLISEPPSPNSAFRNNAAHYVYVKAGETIAIASSAQGVGAGYMRLTSPDESMVISTRDSLNGKILNRNEEVGGPDVGYTPVKRKVTADQEGIWKVEFFPPSNNSVGPENRRADEDWTQYNQGYLISAWDVSVRNVENTSWIPGRVFVHVLNLYLSASTLSDENGAFYGQNYVLTKDGYIYKIYGNGSHGILFNYFVNNSGMFNDQGEPSYQSKNFYPYGSFHSPLMPDTEDGRHITHKMFYTMPDTSMPNASVAALPAGSTWLYNKVEIAKIDDVTLEYIEGDSSFINNKGGFIEFHTDYVQNARYEIVIETKSDNIPLTRRTIIHNGQFGLNRLYWDGLDNDRRLMPGGEYPVSISVALLEGEIHFPYFDMEINPNGITIDRINPDGTFYSEAEVYWDNREIFGNGPEEEKSKLLFYLGGESHKYRHTWGNYRQNDAWFENQYRNPSFPNQLNIPHEMRNANYGAYSFGNEKAMDTWSYGISKADVIQPITVLVSDLEVVNITTAQDTIEPGDLLSYQVVARNNGPSDAIGAGFEFRLPEGLHIENATITSDCNAMRENELTIDGGRMEAVLDIPNGCTFSYKITARTSSIIPDATYGYLLAEAGIVRPLGYTDPDATLADRRQTAPLSAWEECNDGCNNIKANDAEVFLLEYEHERGHLALVKTVEQVSPVDPGFFNLGDLLRYTFTVTNIGPTNGVWVGEIQIEDPMLSSTPILPPNRRLGLGESTTVSREYRITQADLDRKYVENTATVFGKNPRGFTVKDISGTDIDNAQPTRIILDKKPYLKLKKTVRNRGTGEDGQFTIGDKIIYRFEIKHEGDIPVEKMNIIDEKLQSDPISVPTASILNRTFTFESGYEITAKDILQGTVTNSATLQGHDTKYGNFLEDISGLSFEDDFPTVTTLAQPPMAVDDKFEIYQGNIGVFDVLSNDVLGSSRLDANSIEIVGHPALGRVRAEGSKIHYEPADNYVYGTDNFSYRVRDRSRLYTEATTVTVEILRTIPVAVGDFTKIGYNYQGTLRPLSNDYVLHSQLIPESLEIIDYPRYGQVVNQGEGVLRYTPDHNYTGYDNIVYRVRDKNGNWSEPATIKIEVAGFFIPNAFTPNDDNKNDRLEIIGIYQFDRVELEVIDRFGRQVFYSSDYNNDWAGRNSLDGHQLEEGTYFVTFKGIKAKEKPIVRRGTILITRDRLHSF